MITKASNGWLEKLKKRHNIVFQNLCNESASASDTTGNEWKIDLQGPKDYKPHNVFNVDDTALFYKRLPDRIL